MQRNKLLWEYDILPKVTWKTQSPFSLYLQKEQQVKHCPEILFPVYAQNIYLG